MNWRIKGAVQKALSILPFGVAANDLLRSAVGRPRGLDGEIAMKIRNDWLVLAAHMRELGLPIEGREFLEIGTGWYPTLPFCYSLAGASRCHTYDLTRHMDGRLTASLVDTLPEHLPAIAEASGRPLADVQAAHAAIAGAATLPARLEAARVVYHAPADASRTGLPDASVDVVFSNSVLEHVPGGVIARIMAETYRVLRPGGVAIHSVNCGDHYAYFDRSITQVNYLSYTERQWAWWNNDIQYQNRLRACDFVDLAKAAGFDIVMDKHHAKPHLLAQVERMGVAPEFRHYPPEQLACTSIDFVARRPAQPA